MDSDNILSILAALGQNPTPFADPGAPPPPPPGYTEENGITPLTYQPLPEASSSPAVNVLQGLEAPTYAAPPADPQQSASLAIANMAPPEQPKAAPASSASEPPRKRRSVLETIGRLADVFAKVGGAEALYEPTLNARADRLREVDMEALRKSLLEQQVTAGNLEVGAAERKRIGTALGALAERDDAAALWPSVAEQAGIDPQKAAAIGQILATNPKAASIFARSLGADIDNLGKNVYFGTDPQGKTVAYQVGDDGRPRILDFGGALAPSDPTKVINTGGASVIVGSGGQIKRVLPNTEAPGRAEDRASRERIAASRPGAAGKGGADASMIETTQGSLDELRTIYRDLNQMGAMVSPSRSATDNIAARVRASGPGQLLEGAVGTEAQTLRDRVASIRPGLMQSLAKATGMTGRQLDSNADVKLFMQTVTNPAASFEANMKAIDGLERFLKANAKKPTPAAPSKPAAAKGWSIVKVQ